MNYRSTLEIINDLEIFRTRYAVYMLPRANEGIQNVIDKLRQDLGVKVHDQADGLRTLVANMARDSFKNLAGG
jgi:hypothetical protein